MASSTSSPARVLLVELWGLGDAVVMTTLIRPLLEVNSEITVLGKAATAELLKPAYPALKFITLEASWTAFRGKYRLWEWPWRELVRVVADCRRAQFDFAASVRPDPRDHLLMFLAGATTRIGFPRAGSGLLLHQRLTVSAKDHRVDSWCQIGRALFAVLGLAEKFSTDAQPFLDPAAYTTKKETNTLPVVALHCGARIKVRRWDEAYFREMVRRLRQEFKFHLALFPDTDGYGEGLRAEADSVHEHLSLTELAGRLAASDLLIANDSGPGHIAAALGVPVLAFFGPTNPDWYRPYGDANHIVIRDICPYRPCFDYCHFPEPICLKQLTPDQTWPEVRDWFQRQLARRQPLPAHE